MERAYLVVIRFDRQRRKVWELADELQELAELTTSAGGVVVGTMEVRRHDTIASTFIGSGKLDELAAAAAAAKANVVIFNQELSPSQQRNIEAVLNIKTIDRTQLILDIFAGRAKSQEGKLQIELAQLRYVMPRLSGQGVMLSRLGGGIGTRGPGETKLEMDRRRIRDEIARVRRELDKLSDRRAAMRGRRQEARVPVVAMVGYTNAGKTTLLNRLTGAGGLAQNRLFTTLDPLARRLHLPGGSDIILTDTVGFLHELPHNLIEAFKATLEEASDADLLLHVVDAVHPLAAQHVEAVGDVLHMLDLTGKRRLTVLNKIDQITDQALFTQLERTVPNPVAISAKSGEGINELLRQIDLSLKPS